MTLVFCPCDSHIQEAHPFLHIFQLGNIQQIFISCHIPDQTILLIMEISRFINTLQIIERGQHDDRIFQSFAGVDRGDDYRFAVCLHNGFMFFGFFLILLHHFLQIGYHCIGSQFPGDFSRM